MSDPKPADPKPIHLLRAVESLGQIAKTVADAALELEQRHAALLTRFEGFERAHKNCGGLLAAAEQKLTAKQARVEELTTECDDWSEIASASEEETASAVARADQAEQALTELRAALATAEAQIDQYEQKLQPRPTRALAPAAVTVPTAQRPAADEEIPIGSRWERRNTPGTVAVVDRFTGGGQVILKVRGKGHNGSERPTSLMREKLLTGWVRLSP